VHEYFESDVRPLLIPVGLDPAHPFPQVANKSLNFIVRLAGKDAFGRENEIAIVKVPRVLPRVIPMPAKVRGKKKLFVSLSSVIRAHLDLLFPGREVGQFSQFRVTRHSDLAVGEEDVRNLRTALRLGLQQRHYGQAVRLEVSSGCSEHLSSFLLKQFNLPPARCTACMAPSTWRACSS
jgi:polyphosphate kinase